MLRTLHFGCILILLSALSLGESTAELKFVLDFPNSMPEHYAFKLQSDGKASYESSGRISQESEETDSFTFDFSLSPAMRQKIFDLAARAKYFQHDVDSHRKNMAFTGKKTLAYKEGQRSGESTYNYSNDMAVQELTSLFQNLSATLETGRRLQYDHRYQKLALEEELKRTEESARGTPPVELQAIAPILQQIVSDPSVINVSRARAQRLLALAR